MSLRSKPLWPAIPGGHPAGHRCATLKMAPGHSLVAWLMCSLIPAVSLAQSPSDRDRIDADNRVGGTISCSVIRGFSSSVLFLCISLLYLVLAGCNSTPKAPVVHPGLAVFDKAIVLPASPHSIMREGDQVTYLVISPDEQSIYARFDASCSQGLASMRFPTTMGMLSFSERSAPNDSLPAPQLKQFLSSAQLRDVCSQRPAPDWRALEQAQGSDWLSFDLNSLQRENGLLYVWLEQNPLNYTVGSKGAGLKGRSQERLALDCQQNTLRQVSQFNFGIQDEVVGGQIPRQTIMQPLAAASGYQQKVFKAVCPSEESGAGLPTALPRTPLPVVLKTPEVDPQVIAAIDGLKLPPPGQVIRKLRYRYDAHVLNRIQVKDLSHEVFISTDKASGQVLQHIQDPTVDPASLHLTFRGLFDLSARSINKESGEEVADGRPLIGLSFAGDWYGMPSGAEVSYTRTFSKVPSAHDGATSDFNTVTCRIGLARPASSIHPALKGAAKPFNCIKIKTRKMAWTMDYWYLSDYQLFVRAAENSPLGRWQWRIDSIE